MADTFATVAGIVQFDPVEREVGDSQTPIRNVSIRALGTNKRVTLTVWPDHKDVVVNKGDFVVADGKFSTNVGTKDDGTKVTYNNLSATTLVVIPQAPKREREVVNAAPESDAESPGF